QLVRADERLGVLGTCVPHRDVGSHYAGSGTAEAACASPFRTAAEKAIAPTVKPTATKKKTNVSDTYCRPTPAARKPSGPTMPEIVITAVITFGRNASGARIVRTAIMGALTSGAQNPNAAMTANTSHHGIAIDSSQSGSAIARIATAVRRRSGTFRTSWDASMLPRSAPPPNAAKNQPRTFASAP